MAQGIELKSLSKGYRDRAGDFQNVLRDINIDIGQGETIFIAGPSGSGKSTLLNLIAGLHLPDKGEIYVDGTLVNALSESKRDRFRFNKIGYIFQTFNLISTLSALENLTVPTALAGGEIGTEKSAKKILEKLGLAEHIKKRPYELSVGQRQRVAVARALMRNPSVLLADEPTANLDAISSDAVIAALRGLNDKGATLILATHDPLLKEAFKGKTLNIDRQPSAEVKEAQI